MRAVVNGVEQADSASFTLPANAPDPAVPRVPLQLPAGGTTPTARAYTYSAGDAQVGDLDGDGEYEYVLKWDPSNQKDNSQGGYTGNVFSTPTSSTARACGASTSAATSAPAPTTRSSMVYDFDGDGRAEVA